MKERQIMSYRCEKCSKCFLDSDMCGATNEQNCQELYENKFSMNMSIFFEYIKLGIKIGGVLLTLVLVFLATCFEIGV